MNFGSALSEDMKNTGIPGVLNCPITAQKVKSNSANPEPKKLKAEEGTAATSKREGGNLNDGGNQNDGNRDQDGGDKGNEPNLQGSEKNTLAKYAGQIGCIWNAMTSASESVDVFDMYPKRGMMLFYKEDISEKLQATLDADGVRVSTINMVNLSLPRFTALLRGAQRAAPVVLVLGSCETMSPALKTLLVDECGRFTQGRAPILLIGSASGTDEVSDLSGMFENVFLEEDSE